MSRTKAQRGPLLSSVVMVMLATAATGLLVIIGFQGLPDTVIPSNFGGGNDHQTRNVDVSDSPAPATTAPKPTSAPTTVAPASTGAPNQVTVTRNPRPATSTGTNARPTAEPTKARTTTAPPKKTTSPSPSPTKVSPTPTSTTQAPTPAPTCGTGRKPRCPKSPAATTSPTATSRTTYSTSTYSSSSYDSEPPRNSSTKADKKTSAKGRGRKAR